MKVLLDTHILLWAASEPHRLSDDIRTLLGDLNNDCLFSVASLWEVVIKRGLGRPDFQVDPNLLRRGLLDNGYEELPITGAHALAVQDLPPLHRDPFDRILIAQSHAEGIPLLTADPIVAGYCGLVRRV
ncbi:type II toxin-antitoxin system VapC family toxin [Nitrospirillum sp. BR 11828]|uniref:type II toxin-antitoxin system VapC family toxin n=1 Tax=Nitrospirillum sp. BR 11828 TaxID=3104325 RepID=UPI002ACABF2D|nr:type II toxin-antitoxin system VapC family toxin [Nitrospirillum sp. BR 11828]MDZ5645597.1 type II toxin-antitoxin system VapC family toxin [Nitrospirillum sp. BR 11828]